MEIEKSRQWIRKRNARIYDEKIKGIIMAADNGSALLKEEIQESEGRLAAVKLGKHLDEVVPNHPEDYFLTNKEEYFLGEKRVLRRQEQEQHIKEMKEVEVEEPKVENHLGKEFQTINSNNEPFNSQGGGFFLTEQPMEAYQI